MSTVRVAMVTARYLPERGGTAIHTYEVARRLIDTGVDVTIVTTSLDGSGVGRTSEDGLEVVRVRARPRGSDYYLAPGIARVLRRRDFDLVHLQGYHTLVAPITMLACVLRRLPFVVTFHSGGHSSPVRRAVRPLQTRMLGPLMRRAGALLAVSDFEAGLFAPRLGLPASALTVIPSGVELPTDLLAADVEVEPLIVCVGRVEAYKGHHRLIEALPAVRAVLPEMRVRIAGSGPAEPQLRRLADTLGVADAVDIAPIPVDRRDELALLLRRAAVVALLSEYESQGLAAHEALALGRPLLVNDSGALSELRGRPNVGLVAPEASPADVAEALLGLAAATPAPPDPHPTWSACAAEVLSVYDVVLADK